MRLDRTIFVFAGVLFGATGAAAGVSQIASDQPSGGLAPTHALSCIAFDEIKAQYTPADLMAARVTCWQAGRYEDATILFVVAGTYARFDMYRTVDHTAHDAFQAIVISSQASQSDVEKLKPVFARYIARDSKEHGAVCAELKRLGPPDYYPAYMIAHGGQAGSSGALIADFDAKKAWRETLDLYTHCDVTDLN